MGLNIKNETVERLATELARMTGESKTEAIRKALEERKARLQLYATDAREARLHRFMEREIWPQIPASEKGGRLTREEEDAVLGYGPRGV